MSLHVESGESVSAAVTVKNSGAESLDFKVMIALCQAGLTTIVASSAEIPKTLGAGATANLTIPLNAPGGVGLYDSYVIAVYKNPVGSLETAMTDIGFEAVNVYTPGLQVTSAAWQ